MSACLHACASVGDAFAQRVTFDAASIRAFATASGDLNPLHHDEDFARRSTFGTLIASGTHVGALMMGLTATHFSRRCAPLGLEFTLRFVRAVLAGTTLELGWTLRSLTPKASLRGDLARLQGRARDEAGIVYVEGDALLLLRPLATHGSKP